MGWLIRAGCHAVLLAGSTVTVPWITTISITLVAGAALAGWAETKAVPAASKIATAAKSISLGQLIFKIKNFPWRGCVFPEVYVRSINQNQELVTLF
jgi:hypothetical protein